jgi:hypothetical protein
MRPHCAGGVVFSCCLREPVSSTIGKKTATFGHPGGLLRRQNPELRILFDLHPMITDIRPHSESLAVRRSWMLSYEARSGDSVDAYVPLGGSCTIMIGGLAPSATSIMRGKTQLRRERCQSSSASMTCVRDRASSSSTNLTSCSTSTDGGAVSVGDTRWPMTMPSSYRPLAGSTPRH